jgi:hypothetical protein
MQITLHRASTKPSLHFKRARCIPRAAPGHAGSSPDALAEEASNVCSHCGVPKEQVPFGCDQEGHKAGGMGAIAEWWPVKAWGPCPKAAEKGLPYTRKGQGTDEMLFGPGSGKW